MFSTHSTTNPTSPPPEHCRRWQGAKPVPLAVSLVVGLIFRFAVPKPAHLSKQAWQLLAIFLATMTGLILGPLPVGAWALVCLTVSLLTKTLTLSAAFAAFTNEVIWLIVVSFFFSRGLVKTGLGDRVALYFVKLLGKSTLGLAYGLVLCELLVSPAVPSTTARAGGIFLPLIMSLSLSADSRPNHASAKKLGAFLIQSQLQHGPMFFSASAYTKFCGYCSLFYSMLCHVSGVNYHHAQNLLCVKLAQSLGVKIANPWVTWFKASSLPALISLFSTPIILFKLYPPEIKETPDAPAMATQKLAQMGPVSKIEWAMVGTMLITVALWISGKTLGIATVVTAMLGLSLLLLLGVLHWDDCLSEKTAWDTMVWLAVLIGMAGQLTTLGVVPWISDGVAKFLKSLSVGWPAALCILQAAYFFIHYLFASQTAHVGALYPAFLAMHLASKVPGLLAALALAYNTNLFGALTHYSSAQAAVYYGGGYVKLPAFFRLGISMALINIVTWGLVGTPWWKILGLY
ncbi:dicarboxylate transporter 2.1, chloroplastic-like isoform X1 [Diospyros lotus]|uniref:dicarboxylate transporter 2.1, chloroplastic-like isoform X1 n=1 Tax=Diospyros lotus TaxID=55363 RepID=UPI0022567B30|nr:dicarboxylate transporter 2.1, chloroplastic-like isoform X1 [Diospyros lotus]